jgi:hypothetical protein
MTRQVLALHDHLADEGVTFVVMEASGCRRWPPSAERYCALTVRVGVIPRGCACSAPDRDTDCCDID